MLRGKFVIRIEYDRRIIDSWITNCHSWDARFFKLSGVALNARSKVFYFHSHSYNRPWEHFHISGLDFWKGTTSHRGSNILFPTWAMDRSRILVSLFNKKNSKQTELISIIWKNDLSHLKLIQFGITLHIIINYIYINYIAIISILIRSFKYD